MTNDQAILDQLVKRCVDRRAEIDAGDWCQDSERDGLYGLLSVAKEDLADYVVRNRDRIVVTAAPSAIDESAPRVDAVTD